MLNAISVRAAVVLGVMLLAAGSGAAVSLAADDPPPGAMKLLPGYTHERKQGFDSIVGSIVGKDKRTIDYEIGRVGKPGGLALGGDFQDRAKALPAAQRQWYKEQIVQGQPVHLAYGRDKVLLVSYPQSGVNFTAKVNDAEQLADALLMILTYPEVKAEKE